MVAKSHSGIESWVRRGGPPLHSRSVSCSLGAGDERIQESHWYSSSANSIRVQILVSVKTTQVPQEVILVMVRAHGTPTPVLTVQILFVRKREALGRPSRAHGGSAAAGAEFALRPQREVFT